jgi:hypothetical protein
LVPLGVAGLIGLEIGGIMVKSYSRSYIEDQTQVVNFVKEHAGAQTNINATAGFVYALGFDPRFKDDAYLGIDTGRIPDIIVVEEFYQGLHEGWRTRRPEDMRRISERLADYEVRFQIDGYRVYMR